MNKIVLRGQIRDIQHSHNVGDIEYNKANIVCKRQDGKEDILTVKFKKFSNPYNNDEEVELVGNIRSYSQQLGDKNKVSIYVFTYFDKPEESDVQDSNSFTVDGRICKLEELRTLSDGKQNIHFILANNLISRESNAKLNSYLPCIAWGKTARELSKLGVNDSICIHGELHSREYTKTLSNGEVEIRVAHELLVTSFEVV